MDNINSKEILFFSDESKFTSIAEIGGKGFSLFKMANNNMKIPGGFILTVKFFEEWREQIKSFHAWKDYIECI